MSEHLDKDRILKATEEKANRLYDLYLTQRNVAV